MQHFTYLTLYTFSSYNTSDKKQYLRAKKSSMHILYINIYMYSL